jgi:DNA-binding PadR family transcriptional regulator
MAADKISDALVQALKQALAEPGEHRLFKSGKLAGLFPSRSGANAEAATRALQDGLLEVARTETKGKTTVEWVRLTPRGVEFLGQHQSPRRAVEELRAALQAARDGLPAWQQEVGGRLEELHERLTEETQRFAQRLEGLGRQVEAALARLDEERLRLPDGVADAVPWARDALDYLENRRTSGAAGECPFPELFAALQREHADLSVAAFHDGLRRLQEGRTVRLLPFAGPDADLPQPEFALFDRAAVLYYIAC